MNKAFDIGGGNGRNDGGKWLRIGIIGFFIFMCIVVFGSSMFLTINTGHRGVLFKRLSGLDKETIYGEGFHVIAPWNTMFVYDVRVHEGFEKMSVLSKNGLTINVDLTYRYRPEASKIGLLHSEVGVDYLDRIILPEVRSATREVIGQYLPEELYSSKRETIQDEIFDQTRESIAKKYLELDAILIKEVILPETLQQAIERKLEQEQASLEYEFRLERERKEAQRKIIEAEAQSKANLILSASLTDKILKDKGIDATLDLAKSNNSKVVIIGGDGAGLPIILNQ